MNRSTEIMKQFFTYRSAAAWFLLIGLLAAATALAQDAGPAVSANVLLSGVSATNRAPWQKHLTLGAGDILSVSLYGSGGDSEVWPNVVIGPDGRINYLEAHDVMAAGLTIDELRSNLDQALVRANTTIRPPVIVTPVTITSKKYFMLGSVADKGGVYTLDRPLTIMEAAARAGGLEIGVFERNTVELADPSHSFIVRNGKRLNIDFEQLFWHGDLTQNIPLEPDDYIYFASSGANEIYVLGQVNSPGSVPYAPSTTILGAITTRGSFTPQAFRQRVLVVRGSLNHPQTFVINTADILKGEATNFRLEPRDIVYVSQKPWQIAEDLLNEATRSFVEAVTVTYTGAKLGVPVTPLIH
jgi:protein involved in polysaccharide export with SLBB domain